MQNLSASAWSRTCWLVTRILDLGTLAAGKLCSPSAACWVCQRVLGNVPWWVEARSASEVVAVAVGGSSDLAHAASPAWGILCAACSSVAAVLLQLNPLTRTGSATATPAAQLECLSWSKGILIEPPLPTVSRCQFVKPW